MYKAEPVKLDSAAVVVWVMTVSLVMNRFGATAGVHPVRRPQRDPAAAVSPARAGADAVPSGPGGHPPRIPKAGEAFGASAA